MRPRLGPHPELVAFALAGASWVFMLVDAVAARQLRCCAPDPTVAEDLLAWFAMILAMMVPTRIASVRDVARRSYRARRVRAVTGYVLGYLAWWCALGLAVVALRTLPIMHEPRIAMLLCLLGAGWVLLPVRERWFRGCHRQIPLCPISWRADLDTLRQGVVNGAPCVLMCWPLMVACTVTGHNLVLMVGGTALVLIESRMFRLTRTPLVVGALLLAAWTLAL